MLVRPGEQEQVRVPVLVGVEEERTDMFLVRMRLPGLGGGGPEPAIRLPDPQPAG